MEPADLGLPSKFPAWRRHQREAVLAAACADTRFVIVNASTGTGKSLIYAGIAGLINGRTLILTQTKGLQDQIVGDYASMGLLEIKGQNNYPCLFFKDDEVHRNRRLPSCDEGPCHAGMECELKRGGCTYYDAVRRAARSKLVVTNYSYWMSINRHSDPLALGKFDLLVLDEAHDAAQALADFVKIEIPRKEARALLEMELPREASIEDWVGWTDEALPRCRKRLESAKSSVSLYRHGVSVVRRLRGMEGALGFLSHAIGWRRSDAPDPPAWMPGTSTDWIIEETKDGAAFQPVWASGYSEDFLFAHTPKIVLISATVTRKDADYLGIKKDDLTYLEYPSPFPRENRPVWLVPTVSVSRNISTGEERIWMRRIDEIIQKEAIERNQKGIIHAVSYERTKAIVARSRYCSIMMTHDRRSMRDTVETFRRAAPPVVLVSPSVSTGFDFPYDAARFQIIAKVPFIDSRPAVIQARHKADKRYLDYVAMVALIQMAGRGVRAADDHCATYIIDDNFIRWFYPRNRDLIPRWFRAGLRRVRSMAEVEAEERRDDDRRGRRDREEGRRKRWSAR
jgi:Rad3-related DNA helicase